MLKGLPRKPGAPIQVMKCRLRIAVMSLSLVSTIFSEKKTNRTSKHTVTYFWFSSQALAQMMKAVALIQVLKGVPWIEATLVQRTTGRKRIAVMSLSPVSTLFLERRNIMSKLNIKVPASLHSSHNHDSSLLQQSGVSKTLTRVADKI